LIDSTSVKFLSGGKKAETYYCKALLLLPLLLQHDYLVTAPYWLFQQRSNAAATGSNGGRGELLIRNGGKPLDDNGPFPVSSGGVPPAVGGGIAISRPQVAWSNPMQTL
jgi:hypothetical protein